MRGRELMLDTPRVFLPLLEPARYKGAWGGRGSGKSHHFAEALIEQCLVERGTRAVCIREVQRTLKESSKRLIEDKLTGLGLTQSDGFRVFNEVIETPGDGVITFSGMQDHTAESIKSLEGFRIAWCEEAQTLSARSLSLLRPTIRADNSELWFSWNPRRKTDAVDAMLRGEEIPTGAVVVRANWSDNPYFPSVLEQERQDCLRLQPDQYDHVWGGGYATVLVGAYFARELAAARADGRIGRVAADPLLPIRIFVDIGGTGARSDAFAMWGAQFVGREIRVLDYYEAVGQSFGVHVEWLRSKNHTPQRAQIILPHDGETHDRVIDVSYESAFKSASYDVTVIPNQGRGAVMARIQSARRVLPACWFNEQTTSPGVDALGWYHEKQDAARGVGLGPDHDWSSHGCFHGDTIVLTRYGTRRIMDLSEKGEVLTPCGWKQYIHPRITKKNACLVEVVFTSGYSVKCTPDHLFLTVSGWKSAESLLPGSQIRSSLTRSHSISAALCTVFGQAINTSRRAVAGFTEMFGRLLSERYQDGAMYITGTETRRITGSRTLRLSTQQSTFASSAAPTPFTSKAESATQLGSRLLNGTDQMPEGSGTGARQFGRRHGRSGSVRQRNVLIAALNFSLSFAKAGILRCIAALRARFPRTESAGSKTNTPLRIERVRQTSEKADVWDITVPDGHWFSLQNGAVVHNSDAFGLMAICAESYFAGDSRRPEEKGWRAKLAARNRASAQAA